MANTTYKEKLLDPRWQKKRLEIFNRDNWKCQLCGDESTTMHVHHKEYQGYKDPWNYDESLLVSYCAHCHQLVESFKNEYKTDGFFISCLKSKDIEGFILLFAVCNKSFFHLYYIDLDTNIIEKTMVYPPEVADPLSKFLMTKTFSNG